jgi:hypothetical protein
MVCLMAFILGLALGTIVGAELVLHANGGPWRP